MNPRVAPARRGTDTHQVLLQHGGLGCSSLLPPGGAAAVPGGVPARGGESLWPQLAAAALAPGAGFPKADLFFRGRACSELPTWSHVVRTTAVLRLTLKSNPSANSVVYLRGVLRPRHRRRPADVKARLLNLALKSLWMVAQRESFRNKANTYEITGFPTTFLSKIHGKFDLPWRIAVSNLENGLAIVRGIFFFFFF